MDPSQVTTCPTCGASVKPCCPSPTCTWVRCYGPSRHTIRARDLHTSGTNWHPTAMDLVWCRDCQDAYPPGHQCDSQDIRP